MMLGSSYILREVTIRDGAWVSRSSHAPRIPPFFPFVTIVRDYFIFRVRERAQLKRTRAVEKESIPNQESRVGGDGEGIFN
jgi:hypothetical protein